MTKAEASRHKGAQSRGPATAEGKARSAQNATKHGLDSRVVVLADESQSDYEGLLLDFMRLYAPVGPVEHDLVHEIAANRWRMRRCLRLETAAFDGAMEQDPSTALDQTFGQNGPIRLLNRYEGRLRRAYERAIANLAQYRSGRACSSPMDTRDENEK